MTEALPYDARVELKDLPLLGPDQRPDAMARVSGEGGERVQDGAGRTGDG
jgi:hypothetical protein